MKGLIIFSSFIFIIMMTSVIFNLPLTHGIDYQIFNWLMNQFGEPTMTFHQSIFNSYMTFVASYGDVLTFVILTIVASIILMIKKYRLFAMWILGTVAGGGILGMVLKNVLHRHRPYDHLLNDSGFSFPSGHSLSSTMIVMLLIMVFIPKIHRKMLKWSTNTVVIVLWLSILFSRLYFHAHFMTDVLGGTSLGILWVTLSLMFYERLHPYFNHLKWFEQGKYFNLNLDFDFIRHKGAGT